MSKGTKKGRTQVERRKHPRRKAASPTSASTASKASAKSTTQGATKKTAKSKSDSALRTSLTLGPTTELEQCCACSKELGHETRALFVEEEIGRVFCSEDCITTYFQPEIERLEKEYFKYRTKDDLSPDEREQFSHLRWVTLQEPDEVWQQKTSAGDYRHVLISEFKPNSGTVWCVCICLFLRGEPSFLYLAFPTSSKSLVNHFRKGERVEWTKPDPQAAAQVMDEEAPTDGLAGEWTESESLRAENHGARPMDDIPSDEFGQYEHLLEPTLEEPDELWVIESADDGEQDTYHFLKKSEDVWYIIIAQETEEGDQLEILDHFPTRSPEFADRFRRGRQEMISDDGVAPASRLVH